MGTLINAITIIIGGLIGIILHKGIPPKIKKIVYQAIGLTSILIGIQMALKVENILILIVSMLIGSILGELVNLDSYIENIGNYLKKKIKSKNKTFTEGFIAGTLFFCVGPMAIIGAIEEGLNGDKTILIAKSIMEGFVAVALASTYGLGVLFATIPLFIYQQAITLLSTQLEPWISVTLINQLTAVGGLLIMGIGLDLLKIKKLKLMNMLPSLGVIVLISIILQNIQ